MIFILFLSFCLGTSAVVLREARPIDAMLLLLQATILVVLITILERRGRAMSETDIPDRRADGSTAAQLPDISESVGPEVGPGKRKA